VQRRVDGEHVVERAVVEGAAQPVGVAGEEGLGDEQVGAEGGRRVVVRAVVDGGVQHLRDVLHGGVADSREVDAQVGFKTSFSLCIGVHEFEPFVEVVPRHDAEGCVEPAFAEEDAGESGREVSVHNGVWTY
jgi:hypothetical protein